MAAELVHPLLDAPVDEALRRAGRHHDGAPEPEVDVGLARGERVARPRAGGAQRAQPHRPHADLGVEPVEELGHGGHGHLDVLDDALAPGHLPRAVERAAQPQAAVEGDEPVVDVRAAPASGPDASHPRVLGAERRRAPEPVGVPAPQVVVHGEAVRLPPLDRAVEHVLAGVVGGGPGLVGEAGEGQVHLAGRERGGVEAVDRLPVPLLRRRHVGQGLGGALGVVEPHVPQRHEGRHRLEPDRQPGGVAEAAVGVRERVEERVARPAGDELAAAGEDVHLQDRLVRQAVAERRRLDAEARDRAAEGDGAQLRHDVRDEPVRQGGVDEVLVGAHALHVGGAALDVHGDDAVEAGDVETGDPGDCARAEEVGGPLRQAHGGALGDGVVGAAQALHRLVVLVATAHASPSRSATTAPP